MKKLVEKTLNYDANTIEEALEYIDYRNKQLLKFGYSVQVTLIREDYVVIHYKHHKDIKENFGAIYLLKDSRGKGRYLELIEKHNIHVVTLSECNIGQYLKGKEISYYDTLVFSIFWNNLDSVSSKYKFIFENILSIN
jgi:hypothetical protein